MDTSKALGNMGEGIIETVKGSAQVLGTTLEVTGDLATTAGASTGFLPLIAAGETLGGVGMLINGAVDLSDGKSISDVLKDKLPSVVIGSAGTAAVKNIIKNSSIKDIKNGYEAISGAIINAKQNVYDKVIVPAVKNKIKEKK